MRYRIWLMSIVAGLTVLFSAAGQEKPNKSDRVLQNIDRPNRTWDYDGKRIFGHVGEKILLWDATTGKLLLKLKGHKERLFALRFSPDGIHALSSSWIAPGPMVDYKSKDTRTIIWNLANGREVASFPEQVDGEFSPDGKRLVTFSKRPDSWTSFDAVVWDVFRQREITRVKLDDYSVPRRDALRFSADGRRFAFVGSGAVLPYYNWSQTTLHDAADGREFGRGTTKGGWHRFTAGECLASIDAKQAVLIDLKSSRMVQRMAHGLGQVRNGLWSHDGSKVVAFDGGKEITVCDIESGKVIVGAKCGPYPTQTAIVSPDNRRFAIEWGGANKVEPGLGLYELSTGKEVARIQLAEWGHMIGFSPDSKTLLVGGSAFVIYDAENGKTIRTLKLLDDVSFEHDWNQ